MASRSKRRIIIAIIAPLLVAGCSVGPNFVPPDPQLPQTSFTGDKGIAAADARLLGRPIRRGGRYFAIRS
jgi:hypothetical protein